MREYWIRIDNKDKKIVDLHKNINTTSSYYIGEFNEQLLQEFISKNSLIGLLMKLRK